MSLYCDSLAFMGYNYRILCRNANCDSVSSEILCVFIICLKIVSRFFVFFIEINIKLGVNLNCDSLAFEG